MSNVLKKFVLACFQVRDLWDRLEPEAKARNAKFKELRDWVIKHYNNCRDSSSAVLPDEIFALLSVMTTPHSFESFKPDALMHKLKESKHGRAYRLVAGADAQHGSSDFRVRWFLQRIFEDNLVPNNYDLISSFFSDVGHPKTKGTSRSIFQTSPGTSFQKLLYLSSCIQVFNSTGKRKRSDGGLGDSVCSESARPVKVRHFPVDAGQRIGYTVQQVVLSWDAFAKHLGFTDTEAMIQPYVRITGPRGRWEVLTNDMGYAPVQFPPTTFDATPTLNAASTYPGVAERTATLTGHLRDLASLFITDIEATVSTQELFLPSSNTDLPCFRRFNPGTQPLPRRFTTYDKDIIQVVQYEVGVRSSQVQPLQPLEAATDSQQPQSTRPSLPSPCSRHSSSHTVRPPSPPSPSPSDTEIDRNKDILWLAMEPYVRLVHCGFDSFSEAYPVCYHRQPNIMGKVQLVLTDPPYNIRHERGSSNANYDVLSESHMLQVVSTIRALLRPGGHAIVFCSIQQFMVWHTAFASAKAHGGGPAFSVDKVPLTIVKHPSVYSSFPGVASCSLNSSCEYAVHLKKNGLPYAAEAKMVDYHQQHFVASTFPATKNVIDNVRKPLPGEQVRKPKDDGSRSEALRPEQKPLALLKELVARFSKPADTVVDLFGGTFSTAVACFSLPKHRRFSGCELQKECFELAKDNTIYKFAKTILDKGATDIKVTETVRSAAVVVHKHSRKVTDGAHKWSAPPGYPPYQKLPMPILCALTSTSNNTVPLESFFEKAPGDWDRQQVALLQQADVDMLRMVDATASGVYIARSTIQHERAGYGCFAARSFTVGELVGRYYGTLVYHNLTDRTEKYKTYGDGVLGVTADDFRVKALRVKVDSRHFREARDFIDGHKCICIVPAPFCAMGFINDYHYDKDDKEYAASIGNNTLPFPRKPNVRFNSARTIRRPKDLEEDTVVDVITCAPIHMGTELFLDYGQDDDYLGKRDSY